MSKHKPVHALLVLVAVVLIAAAFTPVPPQNPSLAAASVWFGPVLRELFPGGIPIHGYKYRLDEIIASPADITIFSVRAQASGGAFQISGSLTLKALPSAVEDLGGRYMVHLQGYLFCGGRMVWEQQGFPQGGAWVPGGGGSKRFVLIDSYRGSTGGCTAVVLAAGDPLMMDGSSETRVILGIKRIQL